MSATYIIWWLAPFSGTCCRLQRFRKQPWRFRRKTGITAFNCFEKTLKTNPKNNKANASSTLRFALSHGLMWHHLSFTAISHQRFLSLQPYHRYPPGYPHLAQKQEFIPSSLDTGPSHAQYLPLSLVPCFQTVLPISPWLEGHSHCSDDQERFSSSFGLSTRGGCHLSRGHTSFAALITAWGPTGQTAPGVG